MRASVFLADSAQATQDGKVYALGIGWQFISTPTTPSAVVALVYIPWDDANRRMTLAFDLLDGNGQPVMLPQPTGAQVAMHAEQIIEVGRPPGLKRGSEILYPFIVSAGPMPLAADQTYEWRLTIEGATADDWRAVFTTRPNQQPPG